MKSDLLISTANDDDKKNIGSSSDTTSILSNPGVDLLLQQNADLVMEIKKTLC